MKKLFCISPSRTGTTTMADVASKLGYRNILHTNTLASRPDLAKFVYDQHLANEFPADVICKFDAASDLPVFLHVKEIYKAWPDAHFIYLDRDPYDWYESSIQTIPRVIDKAIKEARPGREFIIRYLQNIFLSDNALVPIRDRKAAVRWMRKHRSEVLATIPKQKLLLAKLSDGWKPICHFLNVTTPAASFPHRNSRMRMSSFTEKEIPR